MKKLFGIAVLALACVACNDKKSDDTVCTCDGTKCEEMGCKEDCTCKNNVETPVAMELQMGTWKGLMPQADAAEAIEATLVIKEGNKVDYTTTDGESLMDVDYTFDANKLAFADKSFEFDGEKLYMLNADGMRANIEGAQEYIFTRVVEEPMAEAVK